MKDNMSSNLLHNLTDREFIRHADALHDPVSTSLNSVLLCEALMRLANNELEIEDAKRCIRELNETTALAHELMEKLELIKDRAPVLWDSIQMNEKQITIFNKMSDSELVYHAMSNYNSNPIIKELCLRIVSKLHGDFLPSLSEERLNCIIAFFNEENK